MRRCREQFSFTKAEASEIHSAHCLADGLIVEVAPKDSPNKGSCQIVETVEELFAEEASMGSQQVRDLGRVSAETAQEHEEQFAGS